MDKLRIFLTSKIGWIMEVLITVTILFTSLFLPTAFVDIAVSVTIILMVVGVYAIYGFFFNKEKRTAYGFLLFNMLVKKDVLVLNGQKPVQGMQVHKQLMLQIMSECIAAHHLLCLFVQLAIDKDQGLIKIE